MNGSATSAIWSAGARMTAAGLLLVALLLLSQSVALAHGGGTPQLVQVPAGPYELYAWTSPDPPRAGAVHITVALAEPGSQQPVLDAGVLATAVLLDGPADAVTGQATHADAANKTTYETDLDLPVDGLWRITIDVDGLQGAGSAGFELAVQPASPVKWLAVGIAGLAVALAAWFFWPARRKVGGE